ncbi:hypothetical protein [Sphingobium chungangianum]
MARSFISGEWQFLSNCPLTSTDGGRADANLRRAFLIFIEWILERKPVAKGEEYDRQ